MQPSNPCSIRSNYLYPRTSRKMLTTIAPLVVPMRRNRGGLLTYHTIKEAAMHIRMDNSTI